MKKLLLLFIVIMSFNISDAQIKMMFDTEKNEKEKIEGFMSSGYSKIKITRIDTDEIDWQQDSSLIVYIGVDRINNVYTELNYSPQYSKTIIKLDKNINSREIFNDKEQSSGKTLYYYNAQDNLEKRELYFGGLKAFDEIYEYDNGKLKKMKYVMSDGTLVSYSTFKFDDSNNLLEEVKYNSFGEIEYQYKYSYDLSSKLSEEKIILGKDNVTAINYSYDINDRLIQKVTNSKGVQTSIVKFVFQGDDLVEEIYDTPEYKTTKTYTYNNGLLSQIKFTDNKENSSYICVYDYIK